MSGSLIRYDGERELSMAGASGVAAYDGPMLWVDPERGPMVGRPHWKPLKPSDPEREAWEAAGRPTGFFYVNKAGKLTKTIDPRATR